MNRELKLQVNKVTMENVNQQKKKNDGNQQHEEKKELMWINKLILLKQSIRMNLASKLIILSY